MSLKLSKSFVIFIVQDTGIGIPKEFQQDIFNPMLQVDKGTDPVPFRLEVGGRASLLDIGSNHFVRAHEGADLSELRS